MKQLDIITKPASSHSTQSNKQWVTLCYIVVNEKKNQMWFLFIQIPNIFTVNHVLITETLWIMECCLEITLFYFILKEFPSLCPVVVLFAK